MLLCSMCLQFIVSVVRASVFFQCLLCGRSHVFLASYMSVMEGRGENKTTPTITQCEGKMKSRQNTSSERVKTEGTINSHPGSRRGIKSTTNVHRIWVSPKRPKTKFSTQVKSKGKTKSISQLRGTKEAKTNLLRRKNKKVFYPVKTAKPKAQRISTH